MESAVKRDYNVLLKSNWFSSDIQAFYGVSKVTADKIKQMVLEDKGSVLVDIHNERQSVSADDVIKALGGNSRLEEMQIYNLLNKTKGD